MFQPIESIGPEAPVASILTAARPLPPEVDWRSGVSWLPAACLDVHGWSDCTDAERDPEKCDPTPATVAQFRPWTIYVPDSCLSVRDNGEDYNTRVRRVAEAYTAGAMSLELATGESGLNPSLESTAAVVAGGPVGIKAAVAMLLQARVNAGFYGLATLHLPWWLVPAADADYLIENGTMAMGNVRVSPGPGYPGRNPVAFGPPVAPATGQGWVYISGPVEYAMSPVVTPMDRTNQRLRTNTAYYIAEREAIVRFDPCGVFAVLAHTGS